VSTATRRIAVVGGGVTGLAAALALEQSDPSVDITLLESSPHLGGKVQTERVRTVLFECGPDALFLRDGAALARLERIGLTARLVDADRRHTASLLFVNGQLHALPPGMAAGVPRDVWPLARTRLLSVRAKARALAEVVIAPSTTKQDESIDRFIRRRFGREVAERIAAPLLGSIYSCDTRQLSLNATLPHLRVAERKHRSLLRAAWAEPAPQSSQAASPRFVSFEGGLGTLPMALRNQLSRTCVQTGVAVNSITRRPDRFELHLDGNERRSADAVIVAAPAHAAARMLQALSPAAADELGQIRYASVAVVALAFPPSAAAALPAGGGFLVAAGETLPFSACSFSSRKWPHCAPGGEVVVRCHVHADRQPELFAADDRDIVAAVLAGLRNVPAIREAPIATRVYRWSRGVAAYTVHHLDRLQRIESALMDSPGLVLAGAAYRGVGIAECLRQGEEAAGVALDLLTNVAGPLAHLNVA
jgi:protoporphyrinogen/coproporphyrinogen III oxidase